MVEWTICFKAGGDRGALRVIVINVGGRRLVIQFKKSTSILNTVYTQKKKNNKKDPKYIKKCGPSKSVQIKIGDVSLVITGCLYVYPNRMNSSKKGGSVVYNASATQWPKGSPEQWKLQELPPAHVLFVIGRESTIEYKEGINDDATLNIEWMSYSAFTLIPGPHCSKIKVQAKDPRRSRPRDSKNNAMNSILDDDPTGRKTKCLYDFWRESLSPQKRENLIDRRQKMKARAKKKKKGHASKRPLPAKKRQKVGVRESSYPLKDTEDTETKSFEQIPDLPNPYSQLIQYPNEITADFVDWALQKSSLTSIRGTHTHPPLL